MKRMQLTGIALLLMTGIPVISMAQNKVEADIGADLVSGYIWRGQDLGNVSIQPSASVSYKGFSLSGWGSVGLDKEDTKTGNLDTIYTDESCSAILTNRVPASSGGSTLYEFSTPLKLNYFTKNYYDDNIPYYSVITSLADYITDTNKIAVIIPDTSEANAGQLKYTEVIDDGVIKCYFTQELDGYSIKSIEIRNISKKESVIPKINFTISDFYDSDYKYSCAAESGMTWSEWCSSEYNTIGAIVNETYIQVPNSEGELKNVQIIFTANVLPDDEIKNMTYNIL